MRHYTSGPSAGPQRVWLAGHDLRTYPVVVAGHDPEIVRQALAEWLRTERRLGVPHWAVRNPSPAALNEPAPTTAGAPASRPAPPPAATLSLLTDDADLPPLCQEELPEAVAGRELDRLNAEHVIGCTKCGLHRHRTQTVFGVGKARPEIVFVGEGPGVDEDAQGLPFVGRAGQLLTRMIVAMTLTRDQVYICNVVKCRPPENRTPSDEEMATCTPYLLRQLAMLRPRVIVALGRPATQALLQTKAPIGRLRGSFQRFPPPALVHLGLPAIPVMPTFHPAYLLRSPGEKAKVWEDLKQVMSYLGMPIPKR